MMKSSTLPRVFALFLVVSLVMACSLGGSGAADQPSQAVTAEALPAQPPAPTAAPAEPSAAPVPSPTATFPPGEFSPLPLAECQQIQGMAAGDLKVAFTLNEAPFITPSGQNGVGCVMQAKGTGADFKSIGDVRTSLHKVFQDWTEDMSQAADGPTGSMQGFWRGNNLLLTSIVWEPSADANCPKDQPITACNLKPEQMLYTVTLTAAVSLTAPAPTAAPATAIVQGVPTLPSTFVVDQVIRFDVDPMNLTLDGSVTSGTYDRYKLSMAVGEGLDVQLSSTQQTAGFILLGPDNKALPGTENQRAQWYAAKAGSTGEYTIIVGSIQGRADYKLVVKVSSAGGGSAYVPLSTSECKQLKNQAGSALGVAFAMSQADFDTFDGKNGVACTLTASGTGVDFESVSTVMAALLGAFDEWSVDNTLAADGPTSSVVGLRRGNDLMIIAVQWQPSEDANCPDDQPIATCDLKPEQRIYTIVIQAARK